MKKYQNLEHFQQNRQQYIDFKSTQYGVTIDYQFIVKLYEGEMLTSSHLLFFSNLFMSIYQNDCKILCTDCYFFSDFVPSLTIQLPDALIQQQFQPDKPTKSKIRITSIKDNGEQQDKQEQNKMINTQYDQQIKSQDNQEQNKQMINRQQDQQIQSQQQDKYEQNKQMINRQQDQQIQSQQQDKYEQNKQQNLNYNQSQTRNQQASYGNTQQQAQNQLVQGKAISYEEGQTENNTTQQTNANRYISGQSQLNNQKSQNTQYSNQPSKINNKSYQTFEQQQSQNQPNDLVQNKQQNLNYNQSQTRNQQASYGNTQLQAQNQLGQGKFIRVEEIQAEINTFQQTNPKQTSGQGSLYNQKSQNLEYSQQNLNKTSQQPQKQSNINQQQNSSDRVQNYYDQGQSQTNNSSSQNKNYYGKNQPRIEQISQINMVSKQDEVTQQQLLINKEKQQQDLDQQMKKYNIKVTEIKMIPQEQGTYKMNRLKSLVEELKQIHKIQKGHPFDHYDYIFFPINIMNNHWVSAMVFQNKYLIQIINSLGKPYDIIEEGLKLALNTDRSNIHWRIIYDSPLQKNSLDCGLFCLKALLHLLKYKTQVNSRSYDQSIINRFRYQLLEIVLMVIRKKEISKFDIEQLLNQ